MAIDIDSEKFINEIQLRPALWNVTAEEYSDRNAKQKAWEEIARLFYPQNWIDAEGRSKIKYSLSTTDHRRLYILYSSAAKLLILLLVCGEVWYGFSASGMDEIVGSINTTVIQFIAMYRYKNMMDHRNIYKSLATSMQSPYFDTTTRTRKALVEYWANKNEKYLRLLMALGNLTVAVWYIYPLVDEVDYNLIVGIRLPFKYDSPTAYPLAYVLVVVAFTFISQFVMVTDIIMQAHLIHLLCQLTVLADCFRNLVNDCQRGFEGIHVNHLMYNKKFADTYLKRLGNLVEQHKLILSHTMNLRNTLSRPMLGQLAASCTLICFLGYQTIKTIRVSESFGKGLMTLLFLGYNGFELFIICRWCEEITIQSQKIGEAIYFSAWESGVSTLPGVRSTIKMVIARANKTLVFSAGGMYNLSLTSFSAIVKTSYSALTVLLRFEN